MNIDWSDALANRWRDIRNLEFRSARALYAKIYGNLVVMLSSKYVIISVMGPHAGEGENEIFKRKMSDIEVVGRTFWLIKSHKAEPNMVQAICRQAQNEGHNVPCIFIQPSSPAGSIPTKTSDSAKMFSADNLKWSVLPDRLSPVTGKIDSGAHALIFDSLRKEQGALDLWDYADFFKPSKPLKIIQGGSTLCALRKDISDLPDSEKIKSRFRGIVAVGTLREPYAVWLK